MEVGGAGRRFGRPAGRRYGPTREGGDHTGAAGRRRRPALGRGARRPGGRLAGAGSARRHLRGDGPRHPTLFLLSPEGLRSFYALPEAEASKGVADWMMLTRKLPDELFFDRRTNIADLFGREDVAAYLAQLDAGVTVAFEELGDDGEVDLFAFTRRLGHRMGLACWAGEVPAVGPASTPWSRRSTCSRRPAFVHPEAMAEVAAGAKQADRGHAVRSGHAASQRSLVGGADRRTAAGAPSDVRPRPVGLAQHTRARGRHRCRHRWRVGHHGAMPERPEPAALPQRRHADTTPAEAAAARRRPPGAATGRRGPRRRVVTEVVDRPELSGGRPTAPTISPGAPRCTRRGRRRAWPCGGGATPRCRSGRARTPR